ncbi:MAG: Fic family protein, partial [Opitutaceae bacterium]|nr:Fic family protein [Opitutaceae bacterium]
MTALQHFYTDSPKWHEKIGGVHALLERVKISEEQSGDVLRLRKLNRIMSIHASTAIEGNRLTLAQVTDIINGKPVWGPPRDIKEVQNAWQAYNAMSDYNPWRVADLLKAHSFMTTSLVGESGKFRTVGVAVVRDDGVVMHRGAPPEDVPALVEQLLCQGELSEAHPLIKSSAVHYMLEHIHPFRDGNGRMGRLWQTLILSTWNPLFAWMPVETIIHNNQARYYKALQDSHANGIDCRPFIDLMLDVIENSLYKYVDIASTTGFDDGKTMDVPVNVPIKTTDVPINVPIKTLAEKVFILVRANPKVTIEKLAKILGVTDRTIKRAIKSLQDAGTIRRTGSRKTGPWEILHRSGGGG